MKPVKCFLSFADSRMAGALKRIEAQARAMNFFDDIRIIDETKLDSDFVKVWQHKLMPECRGFGYWVWKPYLIWKTLESLPDGSILLYCDAGCHLNPRARKRLQKYYEELAADSFGIKAFPVSSPFLPKNEAFWSKGDLLTYFSCRERNDIIESPQIEAGHILCEKNDFTLSFVRRWYQVFLDDFSLVDDSPSKSENMPGFIENRHDMSVFSLLFKLHGCIPFPPGETIPYIIKNPIWSSRDRGMETPNRLSYKRYITSYAKYIIVKLNLLYPKQMSAIISQLKKLQGLSR